MLLRIYLMRINAVFGRLIIEIYHENNKDLCMRLVDLEKAIDNVPNLIEIATI